MTVRKKMAALFAALAVLAVIPLAAYYAANISIKPSLARSALAPHYMGRAAVAVPTTFNLESGKIQMTCEGSPGLTAVMETPHQDYGLVAYEALSIMLPPGPSQIAKNLTLELGRPAQLVYTQRGPTEITASLIADYGQGSLRLSRPVSYDPDIGNYPTEDFEREALQFLNNYTWGHRGAGSGELYSLYGRVGRRQNCSDVNVGLLFSSTEDSLKLYLTTDSSPEAQAAEKGLLLATEGTLKNQPSWYSEFVKIFSGQWNRKVRGGPRKVAGRFGLEWVAIQRNMSSGIRTFTAVWRPDDGPAGEVFPIIIMNADYKDASDALRQWDDILKSSTLAMDSYL